jgi:hypothetical protein
MSPKLKRMLAVETMQKTVPKLFETLKNSVDFSDSQVLDEYELVEQKRGSHRSAWQRIVFKRPDGIEYLITVAGLYRHDTKTNEEI